MMLSDTSSYTKLRHRRSPSTDLKLSFRTRILLTLSVLAAMVCFVAVVSVASVKSRSIRLRRRAGESMILTGCTYDKHIYSRVHPRSPRECIPPPRQVITRNCVNWAQCIPRQDMVLQHPQETIVPCLIMCTSTKETVPPSVC